MRHRIFIALSVLPLLWLIGCFDGPTSNQENPAIEESRPLATTVPETAAPQSGRTAEPPERNAPATVPSGTPSVGVESAFTGRIAFSSERDGNTDISVMNADGSGVTRLTDHYADDTTPAWSPDGRRIAFSSERDGNAEIYVMDADGSDAIRLTNHPADDRSPAWSPDGRRIAFSSERDANAEIYMMDADGTDPTRLTGHEADDGSPAWSPDGQRIAFESERDGNYEIYVMDADGSGAKRLTNHPANDRSPAWSPDGRRIAFISAGDQNHDIYVMGADGSDLTNLTHGEVSALLPAWSPDGQHIAFTSITSRLLGNAEIYVMNANGSRITKLTSRAGVDSHPAWFSEGKARVDERPVAEGDSIFLLGGSLNGVRLDRGNPTVTVAPGQRISGSVDISVVNSHEAHAVFPVGATPTWGDPRTSYWSIDYWAPALSTTQYQVPMELTAPATPGTYAILFAAAPETSLAHVMSATRWYSGDPRWSDGDDIAGWGEEPARPGYRGGFCDGAFTPGGGVTLGGDESDCPGCWQTRPRGQSDILWRYRVRLEP